MYPEGGSAAYAAENPQNFRPILSSARLAAAVIPETQFCSPVEILDLIRQGQEEDEELQELKEKIGTTEEVDNISLRTDGLLLFDERLYVPNNDTLKLKIIRSRHDHPTAGHPGRTKTLQLIRRDYYWPRITDFVDRYVASCFTCRRTKTARHKRYGLLQPLPVPTEPWISISMDYIGKLPKSSGFDAILVVVDRLTKMAHFIPSYTTTSSPELAKIFLSHIFSKHGVPSDIVSDRGSIFVSQFWSELMRVLGVKQNLSTAYHPQTDGQTERVNQVVEAYLRAYVDYAQDDWAEWLPLAEFAYNNAEHSSTGMSPFYANYGFHPRLEASEILPSTNTPAIASAQEFLKGLRKTQKEAQEAIVKAVGTHKVNYDKRRKDAPPYKEGDKVFLSAENIKTTRPTKKLSERQLGPYEVLNVVSPSAVRLKLPESLNRIHPVFGVNLLEPAKENNIPGRTQEVAPPVVATNTVEWDVEEVVDSRWYWGRLEYRVKWKGSEGKKDEYTWEPKAHLEDAPDLVAAFHRAHPKKPREK